MSSHQPPTWIPAVESVVGRHMERTTRVADTAIRTLDGVAVAALGSGKDYCWH